MRKLNFYRVFKLLKITVSSSQEYLASTISVFFHGSTVTVPCPFHHSLCNNDSGECKILFFSHRRNGQKKNYLSHLNQHWKSKKRCHFFLEPCCFISCLHQGLEISIESRSPQRIHLPVAESSRFSDGWFAYFCKLEGTIHYVDTLDSVRGLFLFHECNFIEVAFLPVFPVESVILS